MNSLEQHYNNPELANTRGDLHLLTADETKGKLLAANVTPSEAWEKTKAWRKTRVGKGC